MSEGERFRLYRQACLDGEVDTRNSILTGFSKSKQNLIKRFERFSLSHRKLKKALDDLVPFRGLWADIEVGNLGRLCNLLMPEELTTHLVMMKREVWGPIIGDEPLELHEDDVRTLQGLYPALSTEDKNLIEDKFGKGELFPLIKDKVRRRTVRNRLLTVTRMIPSMYTMINNTKFLEIGRQILKQLLPVSCTTTISKHFAELHNRQLINIIQKSDLIDEDVSLESRQANSARHSRWVAYRMLWLFVLRHFPYMCDRKPLMDSKRGEAWVSRFEPRWWVDLCDLARLNGYERIQRQYHDHSAATRCLIRIYIEQRNPGDYYEQIEKQDMTISWIEHCVKEGEKKPHDSQMPELTTDRASLHRTLGVKCGIPRASDYKANRKLLFFDNIYTDYHEHPKRSLTSFAYFRDFFTSFFGTSKANQSSRGRGAISSHNAPRATQDQAAVISPTMRRSTISENSVRVQERPCQPPTVGASPENRAHLRRSATTSFTALRRTEANVDSFGGNAMDTSTYQDPFTRTEDIPNSITLEEASHLLFSRRRGSTFDILARNGDRFSCKRLERREDSIARGLRSSRYLVPERDHRAPNKRLKLKHQPGVIEGALRFDFDAAIEASMGTINELKAMLT